MRCKVSFPNLNSLCLLFIPLFGPAEIKLVSESCDIVKWLYGWKDLEKLSYCWPQMLPITPYRQAPLPASDPWNSQWEASFLISQGINLLFQVFICIKLLHLHRRCCQKISNCTVSIFSLQVRSFSCFLKKRKKSQQYINFFFPKTIFSVPNHAESFKVFSHLISENSFQVFTHNWCST